MKPGSYVKSPADGTLKGIAKGLARLRHRGPKVSTPRGCQRPRSILFQRSRPKRPHQFAEELLAVERNVARHLKQWQAGEIDEAAVQTYLDSIAPLIRQRLFKNLQYLFHRFSADLVDYATVACPAVTRRFQAGL